VPGAIAAEAGVSVPTVELLFGTNPDTEAKCQSFADAEQRAGRAASGGRSHHRRVAWSSIIQHHASHCS
jgi:hypothetical protein